MPTLPMVLTATANPSRRFASLLTSKPRFRKQTRTICSVFETLRVFEANTGSIQ
jgi:hypothetical protein